MTDNLYAIEDKDGRPLVVGSVILSSKIYFGGELAYAYVAQLNKQSFRYFQLTLRDKPDYTCYFASEEMMKRFFRRDTSLVDMTGWMTYRADKTLIVPVAILPQDMQRVVRDVLDPFFKIQRNGLGYVQP